MKDNDQALENAEQEKLINTIKPYVHVDADGKLILKNVPEDLYKEYNLSALEDHFDYINKRVEDNLLVIDNQLNIKPTGFQPMATYGKWTYHWWRYDRKFTHKQADSFVNELNTAAGGAGFVSVVLPPIAALGGMAGSYWVTLGARVSAHNGKKGVLVSITWALVFSVESL
ncbi:hypothetical protein MOC99_01435 [Bacillus haynesii]|uniref:hypothetical protein n=1 Tax=Bacillus haynesii TaxID=1925021 RepID=UPI0022829EC2|nr:hypothetical protein [Bacillus haynesii]MCY8007425.1 hypothetical protein [Bacillus haynesii]MCY8011654.1 hypothetical protein [Bacillus haynesii]MCY8344247.1 hypothetical protein [Bacillus haynesii]MCY8348508.1 hypothetical protein [Bacillus haynesii]MCY8557313.1 hypothetical protein [Bacillus haynesii]